MKFKKQYLMLAFILVLLIVPTIMAKKIDTKPIKDKYIDVEIVKWDGTYKNDVKIKDKGDAQVFIDKIESKLIKKDGKEYTNKIYHVDSLEEGLVNKTLQFYYVTQPDVIFHYFHDESFDRYYFPTQWDWEADCQGEICSGGWVTLDNVTLDYGLGSNTFPISQGGPIFARDGQFNGVFDGESSNVQSSLTEDLFNVTISVWVNIADLVGDGKIVQHGTGVRPAIKYDDAITDKFCFEVFNSSDTISVCSNSSLTIVKDTYYYLTAVLKNGSFIQIYVDSILYENSSFPYSVDSSSSSWAIGSTSSPSEFFNGSIDEVLIYNRSLNQAEITALFNNYTVTSLGVDRTSQHSVEGLVLDINFDDFSVADNSGQSNHGTNTNVSFGVVEDINVTLTNLVDFKFTSTTFQVINPDLAWTGIFVGYSFITLSSSGSGIQKTADAILTLPQLLGLIVLIAIVGVILAMIFKDKLLGG